MEDKFAGWYRVGGRILQFYATDDEIAEWLGGTLPSAHGPYALVGRDRRHDRWEPSSTGLMRSTRPLVATGLRTTGSGQTRFPHVWAIVDRIRHEQSGEERQFADYLKIFERLRRSMRKRLVVETARESPDGDTHPSWRMTPIAADAHVRGDVTFAGEPVGLRD